MSKRIITHFGTPVPPWKEPKLGSGCTTISFILTGKVPSKKNQQQAVTVRKRARDWAYSESKKGKQPTWDDVHRAIGMTSSKVRPNAAYNDFLDKAKPILQHQAAEWSRRLFNKGLIFPLTSATLSLRFFFKDRYITDTVNKQQTIQDVLVACGIIANDDYKTLNPIHSASACYHEEIIKDISLITLSFRMEPMGDRYESIDS